MLTSDAFISNKMHGFSTADGFVEITECLAEMIKYLANEPSVGLFYVQQHSRDAVPNLLNLKNTVAEKSRETNLHTEDLEDSISVVSSMKECGFPLADEMIGDINRSLVIMSTKQPKRGLIHNPNSSFLMGRTRSWSRGAHNGQRDGEGTGNYFTTVLRSAKEKASNFKWVQLDKDSMPAEGENELSCPNPTLSVASTSTRSTLPDMEVEELPVSSQRTDEAEEEEQDGTRSPKHNLSSGSENFDNFKADKEAKLEEWLKGATDAEL